MEPPSRYRVSIRGLSRSASPTARRRLKRLLLETLAAERAPTGDVHLELVSDAVMKRINSQYRGKDKTTDVLSFGYLSEPHAGMLLGEILVSEAVARVQAKENGCSLQEEIARLSLHGLLHVLGYDHETASERRAMLSLQDRYLAKFFQQKAAVC
ncbi:MAG TPA: rRNA maturation RNase YbeY [bacterium]|nr:rRNA maturation RNase YbeY [bacterium]